MLELHINYADGMILHITLLHVLIMTLELDHCHKIFIIYVQYGNLEQMFGPSLTERLA